MNEFIKIKTNKSLNDVLMPGFVWDQNGDWHQKSEVGILYIPGKEFPKYAYIQYKEGHDIFAITNNNGTIFLSKMGIIE